MTEEEATNSVQRKLLCRVSVFALQSHSDDAAAAVDGAAFILRCHDDTLCKRRSKRIFSDVFVDE